MLKFLCLAILCLCALAFPVHEKSDDVYLVGTGIADITGPASDVVMMGYAQPSQKTAGIHFRLRARAYIFAEEDGSNRVVYVSADMGMMDTLLYNRLYGMLAEKYGDLYTKENVMIAATHTHSGPGGYLGYLLYTISTFGFYEPSYEAVTDGIFRAIERAHDNFRPSRLSMANGELLDTNTNRSPTAYDLNPPEERSRYEHNVDTDMKILRIDGVDGEERGLISWFPVHPTSMNNTNQLISGDNKGYASLKFEEEKNPGALPGQGSFVAAFALDANHGDVSANLDGPKCRPSGDECDAVTSQCDARGEVCYAVGPGTYGDMFESTQIIGANHLDKAKELYNTAADSGLRLKGRIAARHIYVDMSTYHVESVDSQLCEGTLGASFAAGTTDGVGPAFFQQGATDENPLWEFVRGFLWEITDEQIECQNPKPILINCGPTVRPWPWSPNIIDMQIYQVGQLMILGVSGEFTTMAGRRLKEAVKSYAIQRGIATEDTMVVMAMSGTYHNYVTTFEEYQQQRYEGASTLFGPYTLHGYIENFLALVDDIVDGTRREGPTPPDLLDDQWGLVSEPGSDGSPIGKSIGDVVGDSDGGYTRGQTVKVEFQAANLRHDFKQEGTYLTVERWVGEGPAPVVEATGWKDGAPLTRDLKAANGEVEVTATWAGSVEDAAADGWEVVYTDAHWETKMHFEAVSDVLHHYRIVAEWDTRDVDVPGTYRVRHFGTYEDRKGLHDYSGTSSSFTLN